MGYDLSTIGAQEDKAYDLSHLGAVQDNAGQPHANNVQQPGGLLDRVANSAPINATLGFGDSLARQLANVANLVPGVNLKAQNHGDGIAYGIGNIAGDIAGFVGGGEALGAARGASEALPLVGSLAKSLAGDGLNAIARRGLGSSLYGAVNNPDDRLEGAALGAALSAGGDALTGVIGKATNAIRPGVIAQKIQESLSPTAINSRKEVGRQLYRDVFDQLPDANIYNGVPPKTAIGNDLTSTSTYRELINPTDKSIDSMYPGKVKLMSNAFLDNPTAENAHGLYKQLGDEIGKYNAMESRMGGITGADRTIKDNLIYGRQAIKGDLENFISQQDPTLIDKFSQANDYWRKNVSPYEDLSLAVRTLGKNAPAEKLLNKITKKQDLYSDIEERTGRDQSFPQDISELSAQLSKKLQARDLAQKGLGLVVGGTLGAPLGAGLELATGATGLYLAPKIANFMRPFMPSGDKVSVLSDALKKTLISSILNRGQ